MRKRVCVFCGSKSGKNEKFAVMSREFAKEMSNKGFDLVYGGGNVGLMGEIANSVMDNGGEVIGVIPQKLMNMEVAHQGITKLEVVSNMHERKYKMYELSDAFVALPGGFGTLDELCEILTWSQIGYHKKPIALLNSEGFFDGLLNFFDHQMEEGFLSADHRKILLDFPVREELLDKLANLLQ